MLGKTSQNPIQQTRPKTHIMFSQARGENISTRSFQLEYADENVTDQIVMQRNKGKPFT